MDKKEISASILIAGITLLFLLASFALFLYKGKSQFWTKKKMELGAILLTISTLNTTVSCSEEEYVNCYIAAEAIDWISLRNYNAELNLNETKELEGIIQYRSSENYFYSIENKYDSTIIISDRLRPKDGSFNDSTELFTIELDRSLKTGNYTLNIYNKHPDSIPQSLAKYHLKIINK
jgi:hypothetical protein